MRRLWRWIRGRLSLRRTSFAERRYRRWKLNVERLSRSLEKHNQKLKFMQDRLETLGQSLRADLEESRNLLSRQSEVMDALNAELEILNNSTVPGLTAVSEAMIDKWSTLSAIEQRKQVAVLPEGGGGVE